MPQERHLNGHGVPGGVHADIGRSLSSFLLRIGVHLSFGVTRMGQREMNKVFVFLMCDQREFWKAKER